MKPAGASRQWQQHYFSLCPMGYLDALVPGQRCSGDSLQDSWMLQKAMKEHTQTKRVNAGKTGVSIHIQISLDFRNSSC